MNLEALGIQVIDEASNGNQGESSHALENQTPALREASEMLRTAFLGNELLCIPKEVLSNSEMVHTPVRHLKAIEQIGSLAKVIEKFPNPSEKRLNEGKELSHVYEEALKAAGINHLDKASIDTFIAGFIEVLIGYQAKLDLTVFQTPNPNKGEHEVIWQNEPFYSICSHHLLPFRGVAKIAYILGEKMPGISKIPRLMTLITRRLQSQEQIAQQIGDAIMEAIEPAGVKVMLSDGEHTCASLRGAMAHGHTTNYYRTGVYRLINLTGISQN